MDCRIVNQWAVAIPDVLPLGLYVKNRKDILERYENGSSAFERRNHQDGRLACRYDRVGRRVHSLRPHHFSRRLNRLEQNLKKVDRLFRQDFAPAF